MKNVSSPALLNDFRTERLIVQHWASTLRNQDERQLIVKALMNILTPAVLEHLPPSFQMEQTEEIVSSWITNRAAESDVFLVKLQQSKTLIGLLILVNDQISGPTSKVHIGYLLSQSAWGKGFASELVSGLVIEARDHAPMTLIGGVAKGNKASAHILRKRGFSLHPELSNDDVEVCALNIRKIP
jgi:RimJ/RimL family protein N-acetyltransferase